MSTPATVAPAVRMSEGPTSPASVSLTDNDDLLLEIFLRLPPLPSAHSPSASAGTACFPTPASSAASALTTGRLLCLAYSPTFSFVPLLSPPDQIPYEHFRLPQSTGKGWHFYGCRHGLAAFLNGSWTEACVWEPFTGSQRRIPFPQVMKVNKEHAVFNCAVLSAMDDTGDGYLHSEGYLSQFKFTLIFTNYDDNLIWACLYDSQSGEWVISAQ
ncbi:hypothetical protein QOZ80_5AG0376240 [Eleusine coracana subsp. coracana]|nr:hypothetical protein QOZ80_5AG0376240 [Eleusine coracana subsp. coracana]